MPIEKYQRMLALKQYGVVLVSINEPILIFYTLQFIDEIQFIYILVSVISITIMGILIILEISAYMTPKVTEELFVDTTRNNKLNINLDLIIPQLACKCRY